MMTFLWAMLGIVGGFLVVLVILYLLVRSILNKTGFKKYSLSKLFREIQTEKRRQSLRPKQVSGMTSVLLPTILDDFPDFNEKEFYSKTEEHLRNILNSIEEKKIDYLKSDDYDLVREKINHQICDLAGNDISYRYDDIIFHKHSIKSYKKIQGMVKLEISTSLEYYYEKKEKEKTVDSSKQKKQTRYTTSYVYIYDTKRAGFDINVLGLNCPNCGSPIPSLENGTCAYCQSGFNITVASLLKCWKIIEIKEDY